MTDTGTTRQRASATRENQESTRNSNAEENKFQDTGKEQNPEHSGATKTTIAATIFSPALITTLLLIFGGCCSNVYTLEAILKVSPASGTLITFLQFLLTSVFFLSSQLTTASRAPGVKNSSVLPRLRQRTVPLQKWLLYTIMFLAINVLNNAAFDYRISVPLHIILRSAGPVTSMLMGYFVAGRRYTSRQITAVLLLFSGVALAAYSDAQAKMKPKTSSIKTQGSSASELSTTKITEQLPGFVFLFSALLLSAIMGIYSDRLYLDHGRTSDMTNENLFYSHTLSLPFFALQTRSLTAQYNRLIANPGMSSSDAASTFTTSNLWAVVARLLPFAQTGKYGIDFDATTVMTVFTLFANALTQIVCITGVNRLSTQTTSLTVTVVLNIRKLVSLLLSIWLFGNTLSVGVAMGAVLVFLGGGLYGWKGRGNTPSTKKSN